MAKLPKDVQAAAEDVEVGKFDALPAGPYICKLNKVITTDDKGKQLVGQKSGVPYWRWELEIVEGEEHAGRRFWQTTSLGESSAFKMREMFDAFGYELDSDTDEIVENGDKVKVMVSKDVQKEGQRAGEMQNNVVRVLSYDEALEEKALVSTAKY